MPFPTFRFRRSPRSFAFGAFTLVLPAALALSGLGFLRAHGAGQSADQGWPGVASLAGAAGAAEVCDGRSLCFEFTTAADGPLWVLVQNRPGPAARGVLISRTPGFEDCHALRSGSLAEEHLLAALRELAGRGGEDARVQGNLQRLGALIASRQRPTPALTDWYLY